MAKLLSLLHLLTFGVLGFLASSAISGGPAVLLIDCPGSSSLRSSTNDSSVGSEIWFSTSGAPAVSSGYERSAITSGELYSWAPGSVVSLNGTSSGSQFTITMKSSGEGSVTRIANDTGKSYTFYCSPSADKYKDTGSRKCQRKYVCAPTFVETTDPNAETGGPICGTCGGHEIPNKPSPE